MNEVLPAPAARPGKAANDARPTIRACRPGAVKGGE
jgi:hypothetical protein